MANTMWNDFKKTFIELRSFLLSHHPACSRFDDDSFSILGRRFCIGCFISYPLAALLVLSCLFLRWDGLFDTYLFHKEILLIVGISTGLVQLISSLVRTRWFPIKIIIKVSLGLGFGLTTIWVLTLPLFIPFRVLIFFLCFCISLLIGSFRVRTIRKACANCIYHGRWDICYGFRTINDYWLFRKKNKKAIRHIIFSHKDTLYTKDQSSIPDMTKEREPVLYDPCTWIYHDQGMKVPWLPDIGLEVEREEDIPC